MVVAHACARLVVLYEGLGQTITHRGEVTKGAGACSGGGGVYTGGNWTCRARGEVGNGAL